MNTEAILRKVETLHQNAQGKTGAVMHEGNSYSLAFNGRNFATTNPDGSNGPEWNTRSIRQAKTWLTDYLNS